MRGQKWPRFLYMGGFILIVVFSVLVFIEFAFDSREVTAGKQGQPEGDDVVGPMTMLYVLNDERDDDALCE